MRLIETNSKTLKSPRADEIGLREVTLREARSLTVGGGEQKTKGQKKV